MISEQPVFEVFARVKETDPLEHLGCVHAVNNELAISQSRMTYSEKRWSEMIIVCREDIIPVIKSRGGSIVGFA